MISHYSRSNKSLCSIPLLALCGFAMDKTKLHSISKHHWRLKSFSKPGFDLVIRWSWSLDDGAVLRDDGGCWRAHRINGWVKGNYIDIYQFGILVDEPTRQWVLADIRARLLWSLSRKKLRGYKVHRYQFQYIATFPYAELKDWDCHHKLETNETALKQATSYGTKLSQAWLKASDDRVINLERKRPDEHRKLHVLRGDKCFICYRGKITHVFKEKKKYKWIQLQETLGYSHFGGNSELPVVRRYLRRHCTQNEPPKPT